MSPLSVLLLCSIAGGSGTALGWTAGREAGFRAAVDTLARLRRATR